MRTTNAHASQHISLTVGIVRKRRTLAVEERELDDAARADARDDALDVVEARVLELGFLGRVRRVADEVLGDERLADHVAPVPGRLGEDRA